MKRVILLIGIFFFTFFVFPEKLTLQTGDSFGLSNTDYFFPKDITFTGVKCTVTSVKKIDETLWCLTLTAPKSTNTTAPILFEFFVQKGDTLKMRRFTNPMEECTLKVVSINWNEITFEINE